MKKLAYLGLATVSVLLLTNCSSDADTPIEENTLLVGEKSENGFWEPYTSTLDELYDNYNVVEDNMVIVVDEQGEETFTWQVVEVRSEEETAGYFTHYVEGGYIFYVAHETPTATIYDFQEDDSYLVDFSEDPDYDGTLSPNNPGGEIDVKRFWGWSCGPEFSFPDESTTYRNCCYYILWTSQGCGFYNINDLPGINPVLADTP